MAQMRKYGESKTTRIMMATVPHVTSGLGLRKFQADGFLLTRVYNCVCLTCRTCCIGTASQSIFKHSHSSQLESMNMNGAHPWGGGGGGAYKLQPPSTKY